jgi:hypothetical protein
MIVTGFNQINDYMQREKAKKIDQNAWVEVAWLFGGAHCIFGD